MEGLWRLHLLGQKGGALNQKIVFPLFHLFPLGVYFVD